MAGEYEMPDKNESEIRYVDIEEAENGFVVEWTEKQKRPVGSMEHCDYIEKNMLFPSEKEEEAWSFFIEKKKAAMKNKGRY